MHGGLDGVSWAPQAPKTRAGRAGRVLRPARPAQDGAQIGALVLMRVLFRLDTDPKIASKACRSILARSVL